MLSTPWLAATDNTACTNNIMLETASTHPYRRFQGMENSVTYLLNKTKMTAIMAAILANGDEIAFVTEGLLTKDEMRSFCRVELGIELPENIQYYNNTQDTTSKLQQIAHDLQAEYKDVILIDNGHDHIRDAKDAGFATIPVDMSYAPSDLVKIDVDSANGTLYIKKLEEMIARQAHALKHQQGEKKLAWFKKASLRVANESVNQVTLILDLDVILSKGRQPLRAMEC
ncbi:hypothetical protein [Piscirickettsia salmonis]|uniref:hypothetical protein n=1 Tax=Piscirickettsia salmonis TaxID=1238 RepID=UPI0011808863|nr:hypothetical protein [Piscirickettsia salmonis]